LPKIVALSFSNSCIEFSEMAVISHCLLLVPLLHWAVAQMGETPPSMEEMKEMEEKMKSPQMQEFMKDPAKKKEIEEMMRYYYSDPAEKQEQMQQMGGAGSQQPPFPRKQIGIKTARKVMKDVIATLSTENAKKKLDKASADESNPQIMLQKVGLRAEKLLKGVFEKYGFEGGLMQAMDSVNEAQARKGDATVKAALEELNMLMGLGHLAKPAEAQATPEEETATSDEEEGDSRQKLYSVQDLLRTAEYRKTPYKKKDDAGSAPKPDETIRRKKKKSAPKPDKTKKRKKKRKAEL